MSLRAVRLAVFLPSTWDTDRAIRVARDGFLELFEGDRTLLEDALYRMVMGAGTPHEQWRLLPAWPKIQGLSFLALDGPSGRVIDGIELWAACDDGSLYAIPRRSS